MGGVVRRDPFVEKCVDLDVEEVSRVFVEAMKEKKMSFTAIGKKLQVNSAAITIIVKQAYGRPHNPKLRSMARVAHALGFNLRVVLEPRT